MTNKLTRIPKFRRCVLQNFPFIEQDFDALTDYALLCKVVEYLNKVIANENALTESQANLIIQFNTLKSYVENYFANLDVQEEINNKLDQMAEDGTLQEIITSYIQANVAWTFDTVADMKNATNLIAGSYAQTLGFHTINDGGGAIYKITDSGTANEKSVIAIGDLFAIISPDKTVSPEQYGAYGDGSHEDTESWQLAVNSGKDILAKPVTYRCGKITVTNNTTIDCNHAKFICITDTLFEIKGEVVTTLTSQSNYTAYNQNYAISNESYASYNGYAVIKGTNNFQESRDYYKGGFVGEFRLGKLNGSYPIDVTGVSIEIVNPISGELKNIDGLTHTTYSNTTLSINVIYGLGYKISNIIENQDSGYKFINLSFCMNCICDNLVVNKNYGVSGTVSYIVDIDDSSYCSVINSSLHNNIWHTITTGGTYLCYSNYISNCKLTTRDSFAYLDHANARGTTITDSTVQCLYVMGLANVRNVTILTNYDYYKRCLIALCATTESSNAIYNVKDVTFMATGANGSYRGIHIKNSSDGDGKTYYCSLVNLDNINAIGGEIGFRCAPDNTNCTTVLGEMNVNNAVLDVSLKTNTQTYIDSSNAVLNISNCLRKVSTRYIGIGDTAYVLNTVNITNSHIWRMLGTYTTVNLNGVDFTISPTNTLVATNLYGSNLRSPINIACLKLATNLMISDMRNTDNDKWFNICNDSSTKYYSHISGGAMTLVVMS